MANKEEELVKRTVVIVDGENLQVSLERECLALGDLMAFISNFLEEDDELLPFHNRQHEAIGPLVYIINRSLDNIERERQHERLQKMYEACRKLVRLVVIPPKVSRKGKVFSCTDSSIAAYLAIALYDEAVDKVILVSGDGDFISSLQAIGVAGKRIDMVGVKKSVSGRLKEFVEAHGGRAFIVERPMPGLVRIKRRCVGSKKQDRQRTKRHMERIKNHWNKRR